MAKAETPIDRKQHFVVEDGITREVIMIKCDNEDGFRMGYRDTLEDGPYEEYTDTVEAQAARAERQNAAAKARAEAEAQAAKEAAAPGQHNGWPQAQDV